MAIGVEGWAIVTRQLVVICLLFKQVMASFFSVAVGLLVFFSLDVRRFRGKLYCCRRNGTDHNYIRRKVLAICIGIGI